MEGLKQVIHHGLSFVVVVVVVFCCHNEFKKIAGSLKNVVGLCFSQT